METVPGDRVCCVVLTGWLAVDPVEESLAPALFPAMLAPLLAQVSLVCGHNAVDHGHRVPGADDAHVSRLERAQ